MAASGGFSTASRPWRSESPSLTGRRIRYLGRRQPIGSSRVGAPDRLIEWPLIDLAKNLVLSTLPAIKSGRFYQFSREPRLAHRIANERL